MNCRTRALGFLGGVAGVLCSCGPSRPPASGPAPAAVAVPAASVAEPAGETEELPEVPAPVDRPQTARFDPDPPCDTESPDASRLDMNGDGRAERVKVMHEGRLWCKAVDVNFDGAFDVWDFHGPGGQLTRRVLDLDFDGRADKRELDTDGDGRVDTWLEYVLAEPDCVRVSRDTDGDGLADEAENLCE